jgi:hypothetical protein
VTRRMDWDRAKRRPAGPEPTTDKWWLTISSGVTCGDCGGKIKPGQKYGYQHATQAALCVICLDRLGIVATPSKRLLRREAGKVDKPQRRRRRK